MTKNNSQPVNMLHDLHTNFSQFPLNFRELVMEECKWSCPTYYRKIRAVDKPDENRKDGFIPALSNAEKEGILRMANIAVEQLKVSLDKYQ
ncbi:hypothetical protein [Chitinophaga sp. GbtcB8]|uniref:hypothetical protein n=1 Tax=Chitinophaga sp. GbtcB8 TaxID=2824753 RepID=UPI001C2F4BC6|nr:hypothetical protein [Chitinophaga sp. GbtcB8]